MLSKYYFSILFKRQLIDNSLKIINREVNGVWDINKNQLERMYFHDVYADTVDYVQSLQKLDYISMTKTDEEKIKKATEELHQMFFNTTKYVLRMNNIAKQFNFTEDNWNLIRESINRTNDHYFYGRMDLGFSFDLNKIKLFEYNTGLCGEIFDTAIFQSKLFDHFYQGKEQTYSSGDRLFFILAERWKELSKSCHNKTIYFFCTHHKEENVIVQSILASLDLNHIPYKIVYNGEGVLFDETNNLVDTSTGKRIEILYKTAPWYSIFNLNDKQPFYKFFLSKKTKVVEPMWKTIMGNKALLPYVCKLYPNHPLLLHSSFDSNDKQFEGEEYIMEKGLQGRGSLQTKKLLKKSVVPNKKGVIYQKIFKDNFVHNSYFIMGSFIVGPKYGGFLIKKSNTLINDYNCNVIPVRILKH